MPTSASTPDFRSTSATRTGHDSAEPTRTPTVFCDSIFRKAPDLSKHSPSDLEAVTAALNSRPRKTLGWRTPAEALNDQQSVGTRWRR